MGTTIRALEERAERVAARLRELARERDVLLEETAELRSRIEALDAEDAVGRAAAAEGAMRRRSASVAAALLEAARDLRAD